jgi:hypothetical protein
MKSGCYIILNKSKSNEDKLFVKLGCSKDCESRFKQIERSNRFVGSKDELELMQIIPCVQYKKMERHLHKILDFARYCGEWFVLSEEKLNKRLFLLNLSDYE